MHGYLNSAQVQGLQEKGFRVAVFNPRGVGIPQRTPHLYDHSNVSNDLQSIIQSISESYNNSNVYIVGFSMGASLGLKRLTDSNTPSNVKGMVSIANPFDVYQAAASLNSWSNRIYGIFLTRKLIDKVKFNQRAIEMKLDQNGDRIDFEKLKKCKTTFEYDREFTFKIIDNFKNSEEYYKGFSCKDSIKKIDNNKIISVLTPKGGHVEFFTGFNAKRVFLLVERGGDGRIPIGTREFKYEINNSI